MLPDIGRRNTASLASAERAEGLGYQFSRHSSRSNFLLGSWPVTMWTLEFQGGSYVDFQGLVGPVRSTE